VLLLASLEAKRLVPSSGNVRTVLAPQRIVAEALAVGWRVVEQTTRNSNDGVLDGYWEVSYLLRKRDAWLAKLELEGVVDARELGVLRAMFDSVEQGVELLEDGVKGAKTMDYWAGVFEIL
jgi:hypothetical protein